MKSYIINKPFLLYNEKGKKNREKSNYFLDCIKSIINDKPCAF